MKCSKCNGKVYFDGRDEICLMCGFRPNGFSVGVLDVPEPVPSRGPGRASPRERKPS